MIKLIRSSKFFTVFLLSVFTVIIIVVFVFWGIGPGTNPTQQVLAEVEGQKIYLQEFWNAHDRISESYRQTVKDEEVLKKLKLKERVLNDLINERAALVIASSEGITVSNSEVVDAIRNEPVFQKDGHFDSTTYERILKASRFSPKEYETMRTQELTLAKVKRLVGESAELSENEIKSLESMKEQKDQMKEFMLANKQENVLDIYLEDIKPTLDIKINEQLYNEHVIEK